MMADRKVSVRPGGDKPADPRGVTTIHISNSTNVAIGSPMQQLTRKIRI